MTRRPSFQLFTGDFLTGTNLMSAAAVGSYMRMLCNAWENGPIPDTPSALWHAMHLTPDDPPFDVVWAEVRPKWTLSPAGWINRRLEHTRVEREQYVERQRLHGHRGGRPLERVAFVNPLEKQKGLQTPPTPTPTPTPTAIKKVQRADAPDAHKVLTKLAHSVLDDQPGPTADSELAEELKTRAAKARIPYTGRAVTKALDAARGHRSRR